MNVNVNHVRGKQMKSVLYLEARRVDHGDVGAELVAEEVSRAEGGHPGLGLEPVAHREGELRPVLLPLAHLTRHHGMTSVMTILPVELQTKVIRGFPKISLSQRKGF